MGLMGLSGSEMVLDLVLVFVLALVLALVFVFFYTPVDISGYRTLSI